MRHYGAKRAKFGREQGHRKALIKNLAASLVENESIVTTKERAKETASYVEKLITKAKKGDLHNRRQVISGLNEAAAAKLVDEIAPKLGGRTSGHLKVKTEGLRRGDNALMARISFVDDLKAKVPAKPAAKPAAKATKPAAKAKAPAKPKAKAAK